MSNSMKSQNSSPILPVELAVNALKEGKGVILVDDKDRENEGDLIFPAQTITVSQMAMMIRECSGIVCLCLTKERAIELDLPPMVPVNTSKNKTAFTVSIEAVDGVSTGVSASDRVQTIRTAINDNCRPGDLARPGHVFPLCASEGGILERPGHTEGTIELMLLAGYKPAGVLCELTNIDGTMARLPEIREFAKKNDFVIVTVDDIIQYKKMY